METNHKSLEHVERWLAECLPGESVRLVGAESLRDSPAREVWDSAFEINGAQAAAILTIFKPGSLEYTNASLPPPQTARKCALAMTELTPLGIPTPRLLGHAEREEAAAILCERIDPAPWGPGVRVKAARVLARLHQLEEACLSAGLRELARISDPNEARITGGKAPRPDRRVLVHGDYFSVNILPLAGGLRIIDWETLGWGDPMWDLGFLIGADRDLPGDEIEAVIGAYESRAPLDRQRLMWHKRCWDEFWEARRNTQ